MRCNLLRLCLGVTIFDLFGSKDGGTKEGEEQKERTEGCAA